MAPFYPRQGMALVIVLMILALLSVMAAEITSRVQNDLRRVQTHHHLQQLYWFAYSAEELALNQLSNKDEQQLYMLTNKGLQHFPLEEGSIGLALHSAHTCFNLNAVSFGEKTDDGERSANQRQLIALLQILGVDSYQSEVLSDNLVEFVDADTSVSTHYGGEDNVYLARQPPSLAANRPLVDFSEFRGIEGVSREIYQQVKDTLCVLPENKVQININQLRLAQAPLLTALMLNEVELSEIERLLTHRPEGGWSNIDQFLQQPELSALSSDTRQILKSQLITQDNYVRLDAYLQREQIFLPLHALLVRTSQNRFQIVRHQIGEVE